jgi:hypothetical protein
MNAADVAKTLKDQGQEMILTRTILGTFDPVTGTTTAGTNQSWPVYGITKNYNSMTRAAASTVSGSLILAGDKQGVISATIELLIGDILTIMGVNWRIVSFDDLSPQGEVLMYYPQLRK